jgi:hypothetical protein
VCAAEAKNLVQRNIGQINSYSLKIKGHHVAGRRSRLQAKEFS